MSEVHVFTSISFSYLSKARVLAFSLKRFHPDWTFWLCITDREPPGYCFDPLNAGFDRVIWVDELPIECLPNWLFKHNVVEACTAVKGPALEKLVQEAEARKILYIDPDIAIFGPLDLIIEALEEYDIVLTPHQVQPASSHEEVVDTEIASLRHGIYNLGFIGVRTDREGARFAKWWSERLKHYCYDDIASGLFVDQRWCDLVPALFDHVKILRDPGLNIASWNLNDRHLTIDQCGNVLANGDRVVFFHFTKIQGKGLEMLIKYAQDNIHVFELVSWYKYWLTRLNDPALLSDYWHYNRFRDGTPIRMEHRLLYRRRTDLQSRFPDPFLSAPGTFQEWLSENEKVWRSLGFQQSPTNEPCDPLDPITPQRLSRYLSPAKELVRDAVEMGITEVAVYGAGEVGRTVVPIALDAGLSVDWIVDQNPLLWGQCLAGVKIVQLDQAVREGARGFLVASVAFAEEIRRGIEAQFAGFTVPSIITISSSSATPK